MSETEKGIYLPFATWVRAASMILILLTHYTEQNGNPYFNLAAQFFDIGVSLFFLLSGFLFGVRGRPKTQNAKLEVEDKANDMESYKSKVDSTNGYDTNLKQKLGNADLDKMVLGRPVGGIIFPDQVVRKEIVPNLRAAGIVRRFPTGGLSGAGARNVAA